MAKSLMKTCGNLWEILRHLGNFEKLMEICENSLKLYSILQHFDNTMIIFFLKPVIPQNKEVQ